MKTRRRLLPIAAAIALTHALPAHAFFDSIISAIASSTASAAVGSKLTQGQPVPAQTAAANSSSTPKALQVSQAFKAIRTEKDMESIFSRGQITGKEAMTELKAIKGPCMGPAFKAPCRNSWVSIPAPWGRMPNSNRPRNS